MRRYVADIYLNKLRTQVTVEARDQFEAERMIRAQYNVTGKILVSPDYKYEHALRDEEDRRRKEKKFNNDGEGIPAGLGSIIGLIIVFIFLYLCPLIGGC